MGPVPETKTLRYSRDPLPYTAAATLNVYGFTFEGCRVHKVLKSSFLRALSSEMPSVEGLRVQGCRVQGLGTLHHTPWIHYVSFVVHMVASYQRASLT